MNDNNSRDIDDIEEIFGEKNVMLGFFFKLTFFFVNHVVCHSVKYRQIFQRNFPFRFRQYKNCLLFSGGK